MFDFFFFCIGVFFFLGVFFECVTDFFVYLFFCLFIFLRARGLFVRVSYVVFGVCQLQFFGVRHLSFFFF